jgi:phosphatidylinositol 4-phosphatase
VQFVFHHPTKPFLIWMRLIATVVARLIVYQCFMKRFFSKSSKNQPSTSVVSPHNDLVVHTPELPPKFVVPPVPQPRPHDHIAVLPTQDGLLLRPHIAGQGGSNHYVRITWGKIPEIEELQGAMQNANVNWAVAIIVYGIVGILELFTGSLSSSHFP